MEVRPCSGVQNGITVKEESGTKINKHEEAQMTVLQTVEQPQTEKHCNGASHRSSDLLIFSGDGMHDDNASHLIIDTSDDEMLHSDTAWLEQDEPVALWVKCSGKWQAGIRCKRLDLPLSTLRAKPSHAKNKYVVVFFPQSKILSWVNTVLVCPIREYPQPLAYEAREVGINLVKDVTVARLFILQKLSFDMLSFFDQIHPEALVETARNVAAWKDFAAEASRCNGYPDLGRMVVKLNNMISSCYIDSGSLTSWVQCCQKANSAESIEMRKEELFNSVKWSEIRSPRDTPVQTEWKNCKHEVVKLFPVLNPVNIGKRDPQYKSNKGSLSTSPHLSRKRPKLEVRRAESQPFQLKSIKSDQSGTLEIDSDFFKSRGNVDHQWNGVLPEANGVETTPVGQTVSAKAFHAGDIKSQQCVAFIEAKGRQCVRWANDGDKYCCVHVSSRFMSGSAKSEGSASNETLMCEGTTVLGTKCKHRSLPALTFCKKHRPKTETPVSNGLKRKYEEDVAVTTQPLPVAMDCDKAEVSRRCIGLCSLENTVPCLEIPKRHDLYCEKHIPSWLKRARNGKSRIVSKEIFVELLKDCRLTEQKVCLHQACELFYRLFKSILSLRNPVSKEVQFQWALSEASKDVGVGGFFARLVSSEKERLRMAWGFGDSVQNSSSAWEEPIQLTRVIDEKSIKCKVCSEQFLDAKSLGNHWRDGHKKEAQLLFRGYACSVCFDPFTNKEVLETHVQERHHVPFVEQCMLLRCIPCGSHFGNAEELWLHVLSSHPSDFRKEEDEEARQLTLFSPPKNLEIRSSALSAEEKNTEKLGFVCKLCGEKFELLPDLGRHHQAAHMEPLSLVSSRPAKRGVRYYTYRMKSGRLSRPNKFRKSSVLAAASLKIRSRATDNIKKRIQATKALTEAPRLGVVEETQCSSVAQILFSEIQKTKPRPNNPEVLAVARSACCKIGLRASLEAKYGLLPERLYLKAAKLCSEQNVGLSWHRDGFVCSKGCRAFKDSLLSPLKTLPKGITANTVDSSSDALDEKWRVDESHYVLDSGDLGPSSMQTFRVLCDDISYGKESIRVVCAADYGLSDSDSGSVLVHDPKHIPWPSFTYITKSMLHKSLALDTQSSQLGCGCLGLTCRPDTCDHVYLFDSDYDDARDIYGKSMRGRFPYDDRRRIVLEEGYLVYECNQMCSCPRTCPNRVLQNGVRVKLQVFKTEEKGWAVRAGEAILRGTFVCEFVGEVIDEQEASLRRKRYGQEGCSYLFVMDSHVNDMSWLIDGEDRFVIDATEFGNVSRFINHSCLPNLASHQVLVESMDCERSHIGFYANRDISLGEEIAYDYRCSFLPGEGFSCKCGTSVCRDRAS